MGGGLVLAIQCNYESIATRLKVSIATRLKVSIATRLKASIATQGKYYYKIESSSGGYRLYAPCSMDSMDSMDSIDHIDSIDRLYKQ